MDRNGQQEYLHFISQGLNDLTFILASSPFDVTYESTTRQSGRWTGLWEETANRLNGIKESLLKKKSTQTKNDTTLANDQVGGKKVGNPVSESDNSAFVPPGMINNEVRRPSGTEVFNNEDDHQGSSREGEWKTKSRVIDLSDSMRPTKIADDFERLHQTEWLDAYTALKDDDYTERMSISNLLDVLKTCFEFCQNIAENQMAKFHQILERPSKATTKPKSNLSRDDLSEDVLLALTSLRKRTFTPSIEDIQKAFQCKEENEELFLRGLDQYIDRCLELCWKVCISNPPLVIDFETTRHSTFDTAKYTPRKNSGRKVAYIVWPCLFLYMDGPLLRKGLAEGK